MQEGLRNQLTDHYPSPQLSESVSDCGREAGRDKGWRPPEAHRRVNQPGDGEQVQSGGWSYNPGKRRAAPRDGLLIYARS